jgi:WD40 repeat protein
VITEERVVRLFVECNPVPDLDELDMSESLPAAHLAELDLSSSQMTELKSKDVSTVRARGPRRLLVGVAAGAIVIAVAVLMRAVDETRVVAPATPSTPTTLMATVVPVADYVIDLNTGEMTPLPEEILSSLAPDKPFDPPAHGRYAVSSDGSLLAYIGNGSDGSSEVFVAGLDGTGVRQMTDHPTDVIAPAWSPDGAMIAYLGSEGLFVLDVATGETTQVPDVPASAAGHQFTPDGKSLLSSFPSNRNHQLLIVPIDGGNSTVLVGREQGMDAGFGSLSPDGSLVTMLGNEIDGPGALLFVATTDFSEVLQLGPADYCASYPAGTWSPDGTRIVCSGVTRAVTVVEFDPRDLKLVASEHVTDGTGAIWVDDHTLLVID